METGCDSWKLPGVKLPLVKVVAKFNQQTFNQTAGFHTLLVRSVIY
jgi:hypothetical protein